MSITPQAISPTCRSIGSANANRIDHVLVDNRWFEQAALEIIECAPSGRSPAYVVTANAQHAFLLAEEIRLREIYQRADLSLLLAAHASGRQLLERVAGVDLWQHFFKLPAENRFLCFGINGSVQGATT